MQILESFLRMTNSTYSYNEDEKEKNMIDINGSPLVTLKVFKQKVTDLSIWQGCILEKIVF